MDKFCEDCVHNSVCQYGAIPPHIGRCNDKDTLDDLIPQGEWKYKIDAFHSGGFDYCSICNFPTPIYLEKPNFCPNCGARMREEGAENDN